MRNNRIRVQARYNNKIINKKQKIKKNKIIHLRSLLSFVGLDALVIALVGFVPGFELAAIVRTPLGTPKAGFKLAK